MSQNSTQTYQGQNVTLDISFFDPNAVLTDPDVIPSYSISNPSNTVVVTGQGTKISVGYWQAVYFVPVTAPTGQWTIVWTAAIGGVSVANNTEYFTVSDASAKPITEQIEIEDQWLQQIKKVTAYPGIANILLSDSEIKQYVVWPAMFDYFKKFPLEDRKEYPIFEELAVAFPDNFVFGCRDIRVVEKFGSSATSFSFWNIIKYRTIYGGSLKFSGMGTYGSKYNFNGLRQEYQRSRQVAESFSNQYNTFKYYVNHQDRQVEAYSSVSAKLVINWSRYSLNFSAVRPNELHNVIRLAQSYLLFHLSDSASLINDAQQDKSINVEAVKLRAQELYDMVVTNHWNLIPDTMILRAN